jgi:hypothetical protein
VDGAADDRSVTALPLTALEGRMMNFGGGSLARFILDGQNIARMR